MYDDLERRSPPELSQQTVSSNPEAARKPRTTMKYQPFSAVYDHSCNLDSTFLLVAMYKSICICGCQWGVYASTWPIKKKKQYTRILSHTHTATHTTHTYIDVVHATWVCIRHTLHAVYTVHTYSACMAYTQCMPPVGNCTALLI